MKKQRKTRRIYDVDWERLSQKHLRSFPRCSVVGCGKRATCVDHIEPVSIAPHRRLDPTNLQSLCWGHHNTVTAAYDSGTIRGACDAEGLPLDPGHPWAQQSNAEAIAAVNAPPRADPQRAARLKHSAIRGRQR